MGNTAAQQLFGVSFEEGLGRNGLEFVHPDDLSMAMLSMASMQTKTIGSLLELRMRHADGSWRLMELRGSRWRGQVVLCGAT